MIGTVARVVPLMLCVLLSASCSGGEEVVAGSSGEVGPAPAGSQVLREVASTTGQLYEPDGPNSCSTKFTRYGTSLAPEEVRDFFRGQGFEQLGQGGRAPQGFRWVGVRDGDEATWRKVDIADGPLAGEPGWATMFEVFAPACGS